MGSKLVRKRLGRERTNLFLTVLIVFYSFLFSGCQEGKKDTKNRDMTVMAALALSSPWTQVTPSTSDGSITIKSKTFNYSAKCSGQASSGNQNSQFSYFILPGNSKKLLINFMGGGSCWNLANCFGTNTTTYFNGISQLTPLSIKLVFGNGILDTSNSQNPLAGYTVIFIPYCTGDLHWGSNDVVYSATSNGFNGDTNSGGTLSHRGFDNFLAVLNDIKKNYSSPESVFITGQSAGGYGAIFNAPYIIESLGGYGSTTDYTVVSDAAAGVSTPDFNTKVSSIWGLTAALSKAGGGKASNLPDWISGISDSSFSSLQTGSFFKAVAQNYPSARFGQYNAIYDFTQGFFMNVTRIIRDNTVTYSDATTTNSSGSKCATLWGNANGISGGTYSGCSADIPAVTINLWKNGGTDPANSASISGMITQVTTLSAGTSNYSYYIAPGPVHTISTTSNFYQTTYSGTTLLSWYKALATKEVPTSVQCAGTGCLCGSGTDSAKCAPSGSN